MVIITVFNLLGVGKSRFIRNAAERAGVHQVKLNFGYGFLNTAIQRANWTRLNGKTASEVVFYLSNVWMLVFCTIFNRVANSLRESPTGILDLGMFENLLDTKLADDEKQDAIMGLLDRKLSSLNNALQSSNQKTLLLIMEEAQQLGGSYPLFRGQEWETKECKLVSISYLMQYVYDITESYIFLLLECCPESYG